MQLCCLVLSVLQVLFGPTPIVFGRSDRTTSIQPMQVSKAGYIRLVGIDRCANLARFTFGARLARVPRLSGHGSVLPFCSRLWRPRAAREDIQERESRARYRLSALELYQGLITFIIGKPRYEVKVF